MPVPYCLLPRSSRSQAGRHEEVQGGGRKDWGQEEKERKEEIECTDWLNREVASTYLVFYSSRGARGYSEVLDLRLVPCLGEVSLEDVYRLAHHVLRARSNSMHTLVGLTWLHYARTSILIMMTRVCIISILLLLASTVTTQFYNMYVCMYAYYAYYYRTRVLLYVCTMHSY